MKKNQYAVVIEEGPTSFGVTVPDDIALLESQGENVPEPKTSVATVTVG